MSSAISTRTTESGATMYGLIERLYPICRSITGAGVAETLDIISQQIPLEIHEIASGTAVFDWTVPKQWTIRDAFVKNSRGERVIDFHAHNLHVVSYSCPINTRLRLAELRPHLYSDPEHPDWIPYRTSYYREDWGFCLAHSALEALPDDDYTVCIDSTLEDGKLIWGECFIPGATSDEIVISTHICHPSLANDNLSGIAVSVELAKSLLAATGSHYSIRILFIPGTIGSIVWLATNVGRLQTIRHGLIAVNLGDPGHLHYKRSRRGRAEIDRVVEYVLHRRKDDFAVIDFSPYGYDERQFCSPGINLPFGCLSRTPYGQFPEYHTSADNMDLVKPEALEHSLGAYIEIIRVLNRNGRFQNLQPMCEPQLGKRGLYASIGGRSDAKERQMAMLWVLNFSDGDHSLLDIAERAGIDFDVIADAAEILTQHALLARCKGANP